MSQVAKQILLLVLAVLLVAASGVAVIGFIGKAKADQEKVQLQKQLDDYISREKNNLVDKKNLEEKLSKAEKARDELMAKINSVGGNIDNMGAKIKEIAQERDTLKSRLAVLQNERDELAGKLSQNVPTKTNVTEQAREQNQESDTDTQKPHNPDDEDYWAKILKDKTALQMELDKAKDELSKSVLDISALKKENSDLALEISKLKKDKESIGREIKYGNDLAKNLSIELARAQNEKQFMYTRMEKINDENNDLHIKLKNLTSTKVALEKNIVKLQGDKKQIEGKLLETEGVVQTRIDQIYQLKDSLEKEFKPSVKNPKTGEIDLSPIVVSADKNATEIKAPALGPEGSVVSINTENNFVIVNLGADSGIKIGDKLNVYHGSDYIAGLEVIQVRKDISAADIKTKMMPINVGDVVR